MDCSNCGENLGGMYSRAALISYEVAGDEYIESYWHCGRCGCYTMEMYQDRAMGTSVVNAREEPIEKVEGDAIVRSIRQCPNPKDKRCPCDVHKHWGR